MAKEYGFVRSRSASKIDIEPIYVLGKCTNPDEGIVRHDIKCRPKRLGPGPYTFVCAPDDVVEIKPS